jgi:serpin B
MFSPYSISVALAMTWAGAEGGTAAQMADMLGFAPGASGVHEGFARIGIMLDGEERDAISEGEPIELSIANALWVETSFPLLDGYVDLVAAHYGAEARNVDFRSGPDDQRILINNWVSDRTNDRIRDLLGPGTVTSATRVVITNAVYFKGTWGTEFDADQTSDGVFTTMPGAPVTVPLMHRTGDMRYSEGFGCRALSLPYSDGASSMLLILPDGDIADFEQALDRETLTGIETGLHEVEVALAMPRFEFTASYGLEPALADLGMTDAFDPSLADFSGMTGGRDLFVSAVIHKAFVKVDESGTEAAAATGVVMALTAMPSEGPVRFVLDRPFLFLVMDDLTGTVLFMGRVADPSV